MKIALIAAALPPQLNGVGDYSALLARELAKDHKVQIFTAHNTAFEPIEGVGVAPIFCVGEPRSFRALEEAVRLAAPDWIVLQYTNYAYGRRGYNPELPSVARRITQGGKTRLALMIHEPFARATQWKQAIMGVWQKRQMLALGKTASTIFYSIEAYKSEFEPRFFHCSNHHLPVFSNLPLRSCDRDASRAALGLMNDDFVLGLFGTLHETRLQERFLDAARAVEQEGLQPVVLYIGPHGDRIRAAMPQLQFLDQGALPSPEISSRFAAMDIYLAAFSDGISTRRGSLMAALQHGVATVGTEGKLTDSIWKAENGRSLVLAPAHSAEQFSAQVHGLVADGPCRHGLGRAGQQLYEREFSVEVTARRMMEKLQAG